MNLFNFLGSYNPAYKTYKPHKEDIVAFITNLREFYQKTLDIQNLNEELLKDKFKECVLCGYDVYLNDNRVDASIKKYGKTQVILEFKNPSYRNEMIDDVDINKKSLHEAIWYFYNQDNLETSYQIKNIIITDTEKFFFFDPKDFCNKNLEKICLDFKDRKVAYTKTDKLYEMIKNEISSKKISFSYASFDLSLYKSKILNNKLKDEDLKRITFLYKALHPDFLLREYSPRDSNELNSKFYNELLYILGLCEEGDGKNKIRPSRYKGTLRDAIYQELNLIEENKFEASIGLIIVWLNRILFLKLFEGQLIAFNNNDRSYAFLNDEKIGNFNALNQLFFNVLGKRVEDRNEQFRKYDYVPYLNSSLFEISNEEKRYDVKISSLDIESELSLFKGSVLSNRRGYPKKPKLLKYLLDFLNSFDFASETLGESENKDIVNSSVLGLIFEKLNGYKDGSFFTPGYVTEYMSKQAVESCILQKFNCEFSDKTPAETIKDLGTLLNRDNHIESRRKHYNSIIDNLKVCDPAVGSGHFLVSILNYLIALKSKLGLLEVSNPIEVQNDSLIIYENDGETQFQYKRDNIASFHVQKAIFDEKRKIIENCIFGCDINPNSVQICCLRLWIELLKSTYYIGNTNEMQILPNIDINIKEGNSLISGYKVLVGKSAIESLDGRTIEAKKVKEYKDLVSEYKDFEHKITKSSLREQIVAIKNQIFPKGQLDLFKSDGKGVLKNSMEWMIEFPELLNENGVFQGFDILIGNPPYGVKLADNEKKYFKNNYLSSKSIKIKGGETQKGSLDTYSLFIERGLSLCNKDAVMLYIVPMSITSSDSSTLIQNLMEKYCKTIKISSYQERPTQIFDSACLRVSIVELYGVDNSAKKHKNISLLTTKVQRKRKSDNAYHLMSSLNFVDSLKLKLRGRYAKIGKDIDVKILDKLFNNSRRLDDICSDSGGAIYYRTTGGRYFKIITNYSTGSTQEQKIFIKDNLSSAIGCMLSSTLFWYFLQIYTDGLHIKDYEIKSFPIPYISHEDILTLEDVYKRYLVDIENNANNKTNIKNINFIKEYKIQKSISIVSEIDDIVCRLYGLDDEETKYIKNYEIDFRVSDKGE